jgi:hypothetical protein
VENRKKTTLIKLKFRGKMEAKSTNRIGKIKCKMTFLEGVILNNRLSKNK